MLPHPISQTQIRYHWHWSALSGSNPATPKMYIFQFSMCWSLCWVNQIRAQQKEINLNSVQQRLWEFFLPMNSAFQLIKTHLRLCWYLGQEHCRRIPKCSSWHEGWHPLPGRIPAPHSTLTISFCPLLLPALVQWSMSVWRRAGHLLEWHPNREQVGFNYLY